MSMQKAPFQPPSTTAGAVEQLRNLHRGLLRVGDINQLNAGASTEEVRAKVNELVALITEVTRGGDVIRR